jgi:hypothetical protein
MLVKCHEQFRISDKVPTALQMRDTDDSATNVFCAWFLRSIRAPGPTPDTMLGRPGPIVCVVGFVTQSPFRAVSMQMTVKSTMGGCGKHYSRLALANGTGNSQPNPFTERECGAPKELIFHIDGQRLCGVGPMNARETVRLRMARDRWPWDAMLTGWTTAMDAWN